jgi:hypothetical protein
MQHNHQFIGADRAPVLYRTGGTHSTLCKKRWTCVQTSHYMEAALGPLHELQAKGDMKAIGHEGDRPRSKRRYKQIFQKLPLRISCLDSIC